MGKHVAVYCRVSTRRQDTRSQVPDLERWVSSCPEPVRWYHDKVTGTTMDRPGWNQLEDELVRGQISRIVVWRLDRLGRTAKGLTALFEELQRLDVGLVSLKDGLDLSTAAGRLMANVLASVAQFETELRSERILAGQGAARAQGKRWGGSRPGVLRKVNIDQIKTIERMANDGGKITSMARATGLSRQTVYRVLKRCTL